MSVTPNSQRQRTMSLHELATVCSQWRWYTSVLRAWVLGECQMPKWYDAVRIIMSSRNINLIRDVNHIVFFTYMMYTSRLLIMGPKQFHVVKKDRFMA